MGQERFYPSVDFGQRLIRRGLPQILHPPVLDMFLPLGKMSVGQGAVLTLVQGNTCHSQTLHK